MYNALKNIATVTTGVYEKTTPSGDTLYLQGKHFDENGRFREDWVINPDMRAFL